MTTKQVGKVLAKVIVDARAAEQSLREERERAERLLEQTRARVARGSRDVRAQAGAAVAASPADLDAKLERTLRESGPLSIAELAVDLGVSVGRTSEAVGRARRRLARVGQDDQPAWIWRPGDDEPTPELMDLVRRMIERTPMTLQEIVDATGARRNRVSGAIAHLQYDEGIRKRMQNLGTPTVYRWFLPPATRRGR